MRRSSNSLHTARAAAIAAALVVGLAACGSEGPVADSVRTFLGTGGQSICPPIQILSDARHLVDLAPGGTEMGDIRVAARITTPVLDCEFEDGKILIDLNLPITVERGPLLKDGGFEVDMPYFVAVTNRQGRILGKRVFTARISVSGDKQRTSTVESIEQVIPLAEGQDGNHFVVYTGFQLNQSQLEFNRRHNL